MASICRNVRARAGCLLTSRKWGLASAAPAAATSLLTSTPPRAARNNAAARLRMPTRIRTPTRQVTRDASSNYHDADYGQDDTDEFIRETQVAITRVLTARAVQKVMLHLHENSRPAFEWMDRFTKTVPPLEGDNFLLKLMKKQSYTSIDPVTKQKSTIHPFSLAQQVIAVREDLAASSTKGLEPYVKQTSLQVLKSHLEQSHYTLSHTDRMAAEKRRRSKQADQKKQSPSSKQSA